MEIGIEHYDVGDDRRVYVQEPASGLMMASAIDGWVYQGIACKEANMLNQAFVFLNRYLDLTEAIEDPDSSNIIENSDFVNTDIPYDFVLPEKSTVPEDKLEEVSICCFDPSRPRLAWCMFVLKESVYLNFTQAA